MKRVLLSLFALTATMYACQNPVENVDVGLKETLPTNVELRFKSLTGVAPKSVTVRVTGPDADKVVTILNTKNFRVDADGVLKLATVESVAPDNEHPLRFTVVATADDFMEVVQPITLSDNNQRMVPITMPGNKANGGIVETTAQSDARGSFKTTLTLQTSETGNSAKATVTIPAGALLKDASYKPVDGGLTVRMQPVAVNSAADLPNNGLLASAATAPGEVDGAQQLTNIAGAVTLEIHNSDYKTVKTFSVPVKMAFAVNQQTVNPATGESIKHGDAIPMFSYDAATDQWQQEAEGLIQKNARTGQLECVAELPHLSTWAAAFRKAICNEGATFNVRSNFKDYDVPFYCQVVYVDKRGRDKRVAASFYQTLIDGSDIRVTNLDRDELVILKVYDNPAVETKYIVSPAVEVCDKGKTTIDVRSLKIPATVQAMTFTIQFPCTNVNEKILPENVTAQFRETGRNAWKDLVYLNRKDIKKDLLRGTTYKATKGKRYDLRVKVLGFNFEQPNQLIDKNDWLVKIRGKEFCKK